MWWCSRALAAGVLATALAAALGGCGFSLRGSAQLPYPTIALNYPPRSPLGAELARSVRKYTSATLLPDATGAAAVLDILSETRDRQVLTINAQGRAIEYTLIERLRFRLRDAQGREVIEPTDLQVQREISYSDSLRLSKETEETLLYRDMQTDLVQQLLRRVAAAQPYVGPN